jgi:hypothetical protein
MGCQAIFCHPTNESGTSVIENFRMESNRVKGTLIQLRIQAARKDKALLLINSPVKRVSRSKFILQRVPLEAATLSAVLK